MIQYIQYYEDGSVYQPFYTTDKISKRIGDIGVIAGYYWCYSRLLLVL